VGKMIDLIIIFEKQATGRKRRNKQFNDTKAQIKERRNDRNNAS
jgi:hypothetical protein